MTDHVHQPSGTAVPHYTGITLWLYAMCSCRAVICQPQVLDPWRPITKAPPILRPENAYGLHEGAPDATAFVAAANRDETP